MTRTNVVQLLFHSNQDKPFMWQTALSLYTQPLGRLEKVRWTINTDYTIWDGATGQCHCRESVTGNHMTKEEHTIILILLVTSTMEGRRDGLVFQHSPHILHHSSVKRKHVFSALGWSRGPWSILNMTLNLRWIWWKGGSRINSSCGNSVDFMVQMTKAYQRGHGKRPDIPSSRWLGAIVIQHFWRYPMQWTSNFLRGRQSERRIC